MIEEKETINIVNPKQASMYMKHGLNPIRVYWDINCVVYEFDKELSYPLFKKWCKYELK